MSSFSPTPFNGNVQNRSGQYPDPTHPLEQKPGMYRQSGQTPQSVHSKVTGPYGLPNLALNPMKHVTGPTVPNQPALGKRPADNKNPSPSVPPGNSDLQNKQAQNCSLGANRKKKKLSDITLSQNFRDHVPESQTFMDLLAFEKNLDLTIMKKRLHIQEALKYPMKQNRKLRLFISNTFYPAKEHGENEERSDAFWELKIEGFLLENAKNESNKVKRKFSSFFKSLVIELDKNLYGPINHMVEWHRTAATSQETDGFQVRRVGSKNICCTILLLLDYQPLKFKLDQRLARLLGIHTQTRTFIIRALWQFIKTHKLQDPYQKEYINCDKYLEQIFNCSRMKFAEIPQRLNSLLHPPDPIVINHIIRVEGVEQRQTVCYDIDVEVDDILKAQMNNFLQTTANQQELQCLDSKIHETIEKINQLKMNREFFSSFASDPQKFIYKWMISQSRDLKTMTDLVGNPEEERRAEFYNQPWTLEAVSRYVCNKVQQKKTEREH